MQPWISIVTVIGDLLTLAAAVTDLAATRARTHKSRPRRRPTSEAITARYHAHHDMCGGCRRHGSAHLRRHHR